MSRPSAFTRLAKKASTFTGRPACFALALGIIVAWAVTGPLFGYSDTWQLVINTGTTVITFLMVFLIQSHHPVSTPVRALPSNPESAPKEAGNGLLVGSMPSLFLLLHPVETVSIVGSMGA